MEQAKSLEREEPVDIVLNLRVPFDVIIDRIKGRWTHPKSGRIYHTEFNPPKESVSFSQILKLSSGFSILFRIALGADGQASDTEIWQTELGSALKMPVS